MSDSEAMEKVYARNIATGSIDVPIRRNLVSAINAMLIEGQAADALRDEGIALDYADGDIDGNKTTWTVEIRITNLLKVHAYEEPLL